MLGRLLLACSGPLPERFKDRLYRYCRGYADHYDGFNNGMMTTNGELDVIKKFIPGYEVVFDVGANRGEWAKWVIRSNPAIALHCFEPSIFTFKNLLAKNFPPNVICNNFGLSSKEERLPLFIFEEGSVFNSLYGTWTTKAQRVSREGKTETIKLQALDGYCSEKNIQAIDFLKIDVEGHELEVLRGSTEMLKQGKIGTIQFEYGTCNIYSKVLLKDIFEFMEAFSYRFHKILPKKLIPIERYSSEIENFQYSNWLAMKC